MTATIVAIDNLSIPCAPPRSDVFQSPAAALAALLRPGLDAPGNDRSAALGSGQAPYLGVMKTGLGSA